MRMCFNKNVIAGLAVVALGVLLVAPNLLGAAVPLLVIAACPLSMIFMMRAMNRQSTRSCAADRPTRTSESEQAAQLRELQEEVNRLRAEMRLRSNEPHA